MSATPTTRLPDWEARLDDVLSRWRQGRGLRMGTRDCAVFAAQTVVAVWGRDLTTEIGQWSSSADRWRLLPGGDFCTVLDRMMRPVAPTMARRGDIAVVLASRDGNSPALVDIGGPVLPVRRGIAAFPDLPIIAAYTLDP